MGFICHPKPEHAAAFVWSVTQPIHTKWKDVSLVWAELLMLEQALVRFPNSSMFLIVSGDTVPLRPLSGFLDYFNSEPVSSFQYDQDVCCSENHRLAQLGVSTVYNGHQFVALHRSHVVYLVTPAARARIQGLSELTFSAPRFKDTFGPEEMFLHTVILNTFPPIQVRNEMSVDFVQSGCHAKVLDMTDLAKLLQRSRKHRNLFCARKVDKAMEPRARRFLQLQCALLPNPPLMWYREEDGQIVRHLIPTQAGKCYLRAKELIRVITVDRLTPALFVFEECIDLATNGELFSVQTEDTDQLEYNAQLVTTSGLELTICVSDSSREITLR